jgi:hypothetical protein
MRGVVARLDRATQYAGKVVVHSIGRGVLYAPLAASAKASARPDGSRGMTVSN